jgi:hypothetical protein
MNVAPWLCRLSLSKFAFDDMNQIDSRGKGADSNGSGLKDRSLAAVRKSAYDGPEVKAASDELLHARGNADRALENTEAAGQHLNFVCHVAEFLREARIAMTAQCDEILHDALQRELILLQRDRSLHLYLSFWAPCCRL